jgi:5-methylcytosine-specific restriction enzyme A
MHGSNVIVGTDDSPEGEPVELQRLQEGLDLLLTRGEIRIEPATFGGYRRSSFIGAVLGTLPATVVRDRPASVALSPDSPVQTAMRGICAQLQESDRGETISGGDPLHILVVRTLPDILKDFLSKESGYLVKGSVGQGTWAETPWVAIFDRLVTESAMSGHYLVLLFHPTGERVLLSLNQGITRVRKSGGDYIGRLRAQSIELAHLLVDQNLSDLEMGPLDMGGRGARTKGYEAGNIVSVSFPVDEIPHDAVFLWQLHRFLDLYSAVTQGNVSAAGLEPLGPQMGTESRRMAWHLVAEGRNSSLARKAKELRNYTCQVCGFHLPEELGDIRKRCIEAHHLTPFQQLDSRPRYIDPKKDFLVVCSNCHRLLHAEDPPMRASHLRALLRDGSDGTRTRDLPA